MRRIPCLWRCMLLAWASKYQGCLHSLCDWLSYPWKRGMGFVSSYQYSSRWAVFDYYQADFMMYWNLGQSGWNDCSIWTKWFGCCWLSQRTSLFALLKRWIFRAWEMGSILRLFGDCWYGRVWSFTLVAIQVVQKQGKGCSTVYCLGENWPSKQKMRLDERWWRAGTTSVKRICYI